MRLIGLDIGEKRVGVAVSDPGMRVATPLSVIGPLGAGLSELRRILEDYEAETVVVGLPLTLSGEEGPQAGAIRTQAERVAQELGVRIVFHDERLSSAEAKRLMSGSGVSAKEQRGRVDMVAASILLQGYLNSDGPLRDGIGTDG